MTPQQCAEHRGRIGVEVRIILNGYWQPDEGTEMQKAVLAHWLDALEDWPLDQVRGALISWQMDNPNRRPNPGHIVQMLKKRRGEQYAQKLAALPKPADAQPVVTEEARQRNLEVVSQLFPTIAKRMPEVKE